MLFSELCIKTFSIFYSFRLIRRLKKAWGRSKIKTPLRERAQQTIRSVSPDEGGFPGMLFYDFVCAIADGRVDANTIHRLVQEADLREKR